jgi:hypothetical protein
LRKLLSSDRRRCAELLLVGIWAARSADGPEPGHNAAGHSGDSDARWREPMSSDDEASSVCGNISSPPRFCFDFKRELHAGISLTFSA